ncbi:MAG: Asp-tRNA(Asn)/Glu-tRNA(Gln) amidotransferase subunit GatB [bacterium]
MEYDVVIGIEVHAQLNTKTKLFTACPSGVSENANEHTCPLTLGLPGTLPVLNKKAVEYAVMAGTALHCKIQKKSVFSRKNYFYPDLPKGYQISQFDLPICLGGYVDIEVGDSTKRIGITRIHMEEDAGKLVHQGAEAIEGSSGSLVDLNRAGTPLIEIVSEPDIRSAEEAKAYVETLRLILVHAGVCNGNMQQGNLRADINVSLRPKGTEAFGTRTEIKNVNSFRAIVRAVYSEIERQTEILDSGGSVDQETRNYDDITQSTTVLRSKEEAHDYRYFPEPDLLPLVLSDEQINRWAGQVQENPFEKKKRYVKILKLSKQDAYTLVADVALNQFFEQCLRHANGVKGDTISKWVLGDVSKAANDVQGFEQLQLKPAELMALLQAQEKGDISGKMAKEFLPQLIEGKALAELLKGGGQINDSSELESIVQEVMSENPDVVEKIKNGKHNSANFLMGQVMKKSQGRAKPDAVRELILKKANRG